MCWEHNIQEFKLQYRHRDERFGFKILLRTALTYTKFQANTKSMILWDKMDKHTTGAAWN